MGCWLMAWGKGGTDSSGGASMTLSSVQASNFVQILQTSKVEIYSAYFWDPCKEAKSLLRSRGIDYTVKNVTFSKKTANEMRERTKGKESLPQIFVNDKYFGGLIELKNTFKLFENK